MARTQISALSLLFLFFSIIFTTSSSSDHQPFQILDVGSSLQQARQVFSSNTGQINTHTIHQNNPLNSSSHSFILPLHSRSSLPFNKHNNNYTSLTLSRLARDAARVHSILSKHSQALNRDSRNFASKQLTLPVTSPENDGEYFARIGVGRPVHQFYMVIDTGSDISWLQCKPCIECYEQTDPIYDPSASSTYKALGCNSNQCNSLDAYACRSGTCVYEATYGDGSYTIGTFSTEFFSFGSSGSVPNLPFGCGHINEGSFVGAAGLLGLGGESLSLPSQIRATSFSYCLVNRDSNSFSTLEFNSTTPADSIKAPLLTNSFIETYRYIGLTGISVGGGPVQIPQNSFQIDRNGRGGVILDSGTTVSRLPTVVYNAVRDAFVRMSGNVPRVRGFSFLDTCYDVSSTPNARFPTVSFQFQGGKMLSLPVNNYLIPVDYKGKFCFAFAATNGSLSIIGNVQQQGMRISYNLVDKYIGFSPNKC